jgi:hypothetical protein
VVYAEWRCTDGGGLVVLANLSRSAAGTRHTARGSVIHAHPVEAVETVQQRRLPPWSVVWMRAP